ncbi:MAG: hypothetical protein BA863_09210 [Desulfovibrio sp. S3730MH75]|nr:MAG: hypothetical protein BA863_09210 [Desulfovibrio sp. S3730MH75]
MSHALVDLDGLAEAISTSKSSLQRFWTILPHIRIPSSEGKDGKGVLFSIEDVKEFLINNHGINYVGQQVQNQSGNQVPSDTTFKGTKDRVQIRLQNKKRSKGVAGSGGKKTGATRGTSQQDPHGLRVVGK